jgi:hypothetical protein
MLRITIKMELLLIWQINYTKLNYIEGESKN